MPSVLEAREDGVYHCNEKTNSEELVSNFSVSLHSLVEGEDGNGGHGFLAKLKRFPDETEK